jgi:hypothetical protein
MFPFEAKLCIISSPKPSYFIAENCQSCPTIRAAHNLDSLEGMRHFHHNRERFKSAHERLSF